MDWLNMQCRSYDPELKVFFNHILVITDRLTRVVKIIPCDEKMDAKETAIAFTNHWYRLYGVPEEIISDRDTRFTSNFWKEFTTILGIDHKLSSAYHPQTDGSTERANRNILQMFRTHLVGKRQSEWLSLIPLVEFAINSVPNESTGVAPFQLQYGYIPARSLEHSRLTSKPVETKDVATRIMDATKLIKRAREDQETQYNKRRRMAPEYQVGDMVMLDTTMIRKSEAEHNTSHKLMNRYQGPYTIKELMPHATYRLNLPDNTKMHNSFHTSTLKPYYLNKRETYPIRDAEPLRPQPVDVEEPDMYSVEKVIAHDFKGRGRDKLRFKVLWEGYPEAEATMQKGHRLQEDAGEAITEYLDSLDARTRNSIKDYMSRY